MLPRSRFMRAFLSGLALLSIFSGFPLPLQPFTAAELKSQPLQRFSTRTDIVTLDVSVLDRNHQPVRGLRADDFTVREDGKAQSIEYFEPIELPQPSTESTGWTHSTQADVAKNDQLFDRRLIVILMDDAMIPFHGQMVRSAEQIARRVVERLGPGDLASVVFTRDNRHAQGFTADRQLLLTSIEGFESAGYAPGDLGLASFMTDGLQALFRLVDTLATLPDRRKTIVYISTGIPIVIDTPDVSKSDHPYLNWLARQTFTRAQRGNVTVYPVDPGGLDGLRFYLLQRNQRSVRTEGFAVEEPGLRYREYLKTVADRTGGHAFINTNEFNSRIDQMFVETGSFYLLGYRSQNPRSDGRFRRLQVRVNRPGVTVRARSGYYAPSPPNADRMALPTFPTDDAIAALVPKTDLPLELSAIAIPVPGRREAAVIVTLAGRASPPPGEVEKFDVLLRAFTHEGDPRGATRIGAQVSRRAQSTEPAAYEILGRIDLPPGRYEIRSSAASATSGLSGSVYGYVEVPDFAGEPLTLSGIAISATPAAAAGNGDAISGLLPFAPTTRRAFAMTDRITAFVRVYQQNDDPPAPVTVVRRVIDAADRRVVDERATLEPGAFANARGADVQFEIPVDRLAPGRHLLVLEATRGSHSARRAIPFEIR